MISPWATSPNPDDRIIDFIGPQQMRSIIWGLVTHKLLCQTHVMNAYPTELDLGSIYSPPDAVPAAPPVATRLQLLPFESLSWENFERLCHRLTMLDGDVEHCAIYGRQGEAQYGIDIFARQTNGHYHCLQAKRHKNFNSNQLRDAVELFINGIWAIKAKRFTLAVQSSLRSTAVQDEIERQATRLQEMGIAFVVFDEETLTEQLRQHPVLVDDFFGRAWVTAVLGSDIAHGLGIRLDGEAFTRLRTQLGRVYEAQFQFVDPGSFGSISEEDGRVALTLLDRFLKPDILIRETALSRERAEISETVQNSVPSAAVPLITAPDPTRPIKTVSNSRMRRLSVAEWLVEGRRFVLLGDAGCGKSTLLRVIALDLLNEQIHFPELAPRWGQHIPIYIPFARWSSQVAKDGAPIGIKEIVRRSLAHFLTEPIVDLLDSAIDEKRVLFLIDGLDEWSNDQAARATLSDLVTMAEAHDISVIVSGRPRGLSKIGALPTSWKRGTVAPMSTAQQSAIAACWFERYSGFEASLRTKRFMAELARDGNLNALATVPLLLIGLVTLSLRGQILPRTKTEVYDQLVRILLDVHPTNRATASGDTESRFRHATDPAQRRALIAKLAFEVREQAGGAGMLLSTANEVLCQYAASSQGFDITYLQAEGIVGEILSVNSETQGILVEKSPGEIGFIHASFEEFLGAEYISSWPFIEIEAFIRAQAGEGRWRNVITNLLSQIQRRDEFDRLVTIIEEHDTDELRIFNRQILLSDIAFGAVIKSPATAKRLAIEAMSRVETEDWMPARREVLASVMKGLSDPTLKPDVEQCLMRWLPARNPYARASLISALGSWQPTAQLQDILFRAMHDEDHGVQRAAAAAYAKVFSSSNEARGRVLDALSRTRNLANAASLLESLALGWPDAPESAPLFEEACRSHAGELCLVGILGLASKGTRTNEARDTVLRAQSHWSGISYHYQELAQRMLMLYWPGDETLIKSAIDHFTGGYESLWTRQNASSYLLESPEDSAEVRAWILSQFYEKYPFNSIGNRVWSQVGRFAAADPKIREAANAYWCDPEKRLINMHMLPNYVSQIADPPVAAVLVEILAGKSKSFDRYWALKSLLAGWGREHPLIKSEIEALLEADDGYLDELVTFLPEISGDKSLTRKRLLRMATRKEVRRDLLALAFEACGCDASDDEAVAAIFAIPDHVNGMFDACDTLFRAFGSHPRVREYALKRIQEAEAPFHSIATNYPWDDVFTPLLFRVATPLPVDLRTQVIEVAAAGASGTSLESILDQALLEADPELRVRMTIAYYRALPVGMYSSAREDLLNKVVAFGSSYESIRAIALTGLVIIGALDAVVPLEQKGRPLMLETGTHMEGITSLERLICERFADFQTAFGNSLGTRFSAFINENPLSQILSSSPGASPAARAAFLELAERGETSRTPQGLRALATELPSSELLLARCFDMLGNAHFRNDQPRNNAEIGLILREHFPNNEEVLNNLLQRFRDIPQTYNAIPLAIFAPHSEVLSCSADFELLGRELGDWVVAIHVAANRAESNFFCNLLEAMITREWLSQFDAQYISNIAIEERLQRDPELVNLMSIKISIDANPSISGSFARYLASAGKLSSEVRNTVINILDKLSSTQRLPVAGYDAVADRWRPVRATLLDAVSAGLELS